LGSVRQLLDSTGDIETNYAYDPFGVPVVGGDASNPYQFTGEAWDAEVELLYLRARYYQPEVGRFSTKDPWAGDMWRPSTLNRYVYVTDNPINRIDRTGRQEAEPTPTPTEREEGLRKWIEQCVEQPWCLRPISCGIPTVPERRSLPQISAVNPGVGLVFQRTIVSPARSISFWVVYAEETDWGYVPAVAGGVVKSSVELTVKIYMNGAYVDVFDTYDTTNLSSLEQALESVPTMYRSVALTSQRGDTRGPIRLTNVHRERSGFRIGPFTLGGGPEEPKPLDNAGVGERGKGRGYGRTWFTPEEGLPWTAVMRLTVPELAGGMPSWTLGDSASYGPVSSYQVNLGHIYPSH